MFNRRTQILTRHGTAPGVRDFALLSGLDATVRGLLISVMPLTVYRAWQDAATVSNVYLVVGVAALLCGLMVPWAARLLSRRWMYTAGAASYIAGAAAALAGGPLAMTLALALNSIATVTCFICLNAYVLDYVARDDLGRAESTKMIFVATPWAVGPTVGVWMLDRWPAAPFIAAGLAAAAMIAVFWWLRMGEGKAISRARRPTVNPLAYLGRFTAQPRLVAGWLFAVIRSSGWWVYVVYLPIFCVESGLGDRVAAVALSFSNATLYLAPLIQRAVRRWAVRPVVRSAFGLAGTGMILAAVASPHPWASVVLLYFSTCFLTVLDVSAGLPFLMAVRPSERTEMAAVYSTFRDVSGILSPGVAAAVLLVAPLPAVFAACGAGMWIAWALGATLHPRLGAERRPAG